jgi:LuxR family maltose regulon positive regulatory protein
VEGGPADDELQALALMNLGVAESWTWRLAESEAHLQEALALGRRTGRPYLELGCLATLGSVANLTQRLHVAEERLQQAVGVAERVGWATHAFAGVAYVTLAATVIERGRFAEGEHWLQRAAPIVAHAPEPALRVALCHGRGMLALARGRLDDALAAFTDGERKAASCA